jgi:hypothetical protein
MIVVLSDHNIEGQARLLYSTLAEDGWLEAYPLLLVTFDDVGLSIDSTDRDVWRYCQENRIILLTDNRNMKGEDSLEQTIRDENTETSLPVITIGNLGRLDENQYREDCALRLLEILIESEKYLGTARLFIP